MAGLDDDDRASMEARNAAMKEQMNGLLDKFNEQTRLLEEAQQAAASTTATVTSEDGSVTVTVDATGAMTDLRFEAKSFKQADPEKFARIVMQTVHTASTQVKQSMAELVGPVTEDLPDLSELVDGAPSLRGLMPKMPDFSEPPAQSEPEAAAADSPQARRSGRNDFDDDQPDSWLVN